MKDSTLIEKSKNFGPKSTKWLNSLGIITIGDLRSWDMFELYFALKEEGYPVSRNLLYAVWGSLHDKDWRMTPESVKKDIQAKLGL
jgi:hypothetical protein